MLSAEQPFDVTKAVDFTDEQIATTWVDLPGGAGYTQFFNLKSPMPVFLLGGKGSGRTHLMRYCSYVVQRIRAAATPIAKFLATEGYVGIYMRCEGLNAGRFEGKGVAQDAWSAVFSYYMDLWLAQICAETLADAFLQGSGDDQIGAAIAADAAALFADDVVLDTQSIASLIDRLRAYRREVDRSVNNAALSRSLGSLQIRATRGRLVFGIPQVFAKHLPHVAAIQVVYLLDELENLTEAQQQYVNTLVREREAPCTFKIGSRLYGFRTQRTLSANEENRLGSEYEQVLLDDHLRTDPNYQSFARKLVAQRLLATGHSAERADTDRLDRVFEAPVGDRFESAQTAFVDENYAPEARPWIVKLRRQLESTAGAAHIGSSDVDNIISSLSCAQFPLVEKLNIFLLYQDWSSSKNLLDSAAVIREECGKFIEEHPTQRHGHAWSHFKGDLLAQLLRDCRQRQRYFGLDTFIDMSSGIPRHLFIVLKFVNRWAMFHGEKPFRGKAVSMDAQQAGVLQASNWFFDDSRTTGTDSERVQGSVERLARLLHQLRFSDKPVESSLTTFSFDETASSLSTRRVVQQAHDTSLLLKVAGGAKSRNNEGVQAKYQLNPMLCPRFDLPLARRGTIALSTSEVEAIFGDSTESFDSVVAERLSRMNAPFRGKTKARGSRKVLHGKQTSLPGLE